MQTSERPRGPLSGGVVTMPSVRTVVVIAAGVVALLVLGWMYVEQDKVRSCTSIQPMGRLQADMDRRDAKVDTILNALSQFVQHRPTPPSLSVNPTQRTSASKDVDTWDYNWDKSHSENADDLKSLGVRTIILIRHGQYDLKSGKLTELGRRQANLTGQRLTTLNMNFKNIIHSNMVRALETAEIIHQHFPHLNMEIDDLTREGGPMPPKPTITYWGLPEKTYHLDGPRMETAFRKHFHRAERGQTEQSFQIMVGHGNAIRYFVLRALQFPPDAWMRVFIAHASITLLHLNPDGTVTMTRFGDSGHMPPDMVTY